MTVVKRIQKRLYFFFIILSILIFYRKISMMRQERNKVMVYYVRVIQKESFYGLQRKIIECNNTWKKCFSEQNIINGIILNEGVEK